MTRLAIVIKEDALDQMLGPLAHAYEQARRGAEVDVLFDLPEVRGGACAPDEQLWQRLAGRNIPADAQDFLKLLARTGMVRLLAGGKLPPGRS